MITSIQDRQWEPPHSAWVIAPGAVALAAVLAQRNTGSDRHRLPIAHAFASAEIPTPGLARVGQNPNDRAYECVW